MRIVPPGEVLLGPVKDTYRGLGRCLERGPRGLVLVMAGLLIGWWVYVPLHELLHAFACLASGGQVTRLEIQPIYGGNILARIFPFVVPNSEYAGRLSGFETGGNDLIYLATDLGPFLLTVFPGVWAFRAAGGSGRGLLFGLAMPFGLAPFISLSGDAYEIGSILATQLGPWSTPSLVHLLRGDDLFVKISEIHAAGRASAWFGAGVALLLGAVWAWLTYMAGAGISRLLGTRSVSAPLNSPAS